MRLNLHKKEPEIDILIISNNCCVPGSAPLDEKNHQIVEMALTELELNGKINVIPACNIYYGIIPKDVLKMLKEDYHKYGKMNLPAILINGKIVSYGETNIENIKMALLKVRQYHEERVNLNFFGRLLKRNKNPS